MYFSRCSGRSPLCCCYVSLLPPSALPFPLSRSVAFMCASLLGNFTDVQAVNLLSPELQTGQSSLAGATLVLLPQQDS